MRYGSLPRLPALPVGVIGAGPIGLVAACHLLARGLVPLVLEAGPEVGHAVRAWGHVRMFTPWSLNIDKAAAARLDARGWARPDADAYPTGTELADEYLVPLARALGGAVRTGSQVVGIARQHHDLMRDAKRADAPFVLHVAAPDGMVEAIEAAAVIDCSGTWTSPASAGAHGLPALGEMANLDRIAYGIPDVLGAERAVYAGRSVLVVGAGHSAVNAVLDLAQLAREVPGTRIGWAFRKPLDPARFGGGLDDRLAERGALGTRAWELVASGAVRALAPFRIDRIELQDGALLVSDQDAGTTVRVDRMIVATGFRPDLVPLRELRIVLDPAVQAPPRLAPLIDPNLHSCGTVRPHGEAELRHPEPGFYIAGMKSYGRAPTFLLATGHEQVRSIAAALAGDMEAARRVELVLPETGVCNTRPSTLALVGIAAGSSCCGGPAPAAVDACCAQDATAKAAGASGCGCAPKPERLPAAACCATEKATS